MLDEFSIPESLIDHYVTRMRIISSSNLIVNFSSTLLPGQHIPMLRREVLDSFLGDRAISHGAHLLHGLFTSLSRPPTPHNPYLIHYNAGCKTQTLANDVIIGVDGANSRVAKSINAGSNTYAIAFQERIYLLDAQMRHYSDLAEMYIGDDVSLDFYAWVFPKCDHVAIGTRTASKPSLFTVLSLGYRFAKIVRGIGHHSLVLLLPFRESLFLIFKSKVTLKIRTKIWSLRTNNNPTGM